MTIEEMWQGYAAAVGVPMGGTQWTETRRAFYAGAHGLLRELKGIPDAEDDGVRMLATWEKELRGFARGVAEGRR